ncbi:MAG TPA: nucleotidyltransferase domain-containing protein, partial [Burkholderiaceae bacterium]
MSAILMESPAAGVATLRTRSRDGKAALVAHFMQSRPMAPAAARLTRALARHTDATLTELWARSTMPPGATLVAVGGYGRGELFPHSDVDVLVLLPGGEVDLSANDALRAAVEGFITACWDIGLE